MKGYIQISGEQIKEIIETLSGQLLEDCPYTKELAIIGIATGGVPLAKRLIKRIQTLSGRKPLVGILDITFYRDDIALKEGHPVIKKTDIPFSLDNKHVILVDDVLFSGRTTRAALDALVDFGRPDVVRLAVLIDRGHRELPIHADFIGSTLKTKMTDQVSVFWKELGAKEDQVKIFSNPSKGNDQENG